jgi:hypothetical protein
MTGWDVLERHFDGLSADQVDAELARVPARGAAPTAAGPAAYLTEHAGPDLDADADPGDVHQRRAVTAARTLAETIDSAVSLDQAAQLLTISRSRLSHRVAAGNLWSFTVQGRRYLPRWQFTADGRTLPGLTQIIPAIPNDLHPLAIEAFMTTANPDFDNQSPAEWLATGGAPVPVADWLAGMGRG